MLKIGGALFALMMMAACGSGGSSTPEPTPPTPPTPEPVDPPFSNNKVECGSFKVKLPLPLPSAVSPPADWVVMGSSSAFGAGASSTEKSWVGLLRQSAIAEKATVHNIARGGYTTYHALSKDCVVAGDRPKADLAHNLEKALEFKPDLVILSYPSNDAASNFTAEEAAANLLLLRWQLAQKNIPTLILSAQPRNMDKTLQQKLLDLDKLLKPLVGVCYVDVYAQLADSAGNLSASLNAGDGVHVNDAGHQIIFNAVQQRLQSKECVVIN